MRLTSCCYCCSLKTGTIVSGVCGIVLSVISIILILVINAEWKTILISDVLPQWAVKIILVINLAMTILISTLLIIGAVKRNTFLMLPWVVLGIILAIGLLISVIWTTVKFFAKEEILRGSLSLAFGIIAVVVYVYMWLVVSSYFQQVRLEKANVRLGPYGRPYNYRKA